MTEHFDVIVVGAGLSGIGAAYQLQTACPDKSFVILESRAAVGGTWDLFRYPGIRSDSDMFTLGYRWKPWLDSKGIADGSKILDYVRQTAHEHGIDEKIRFGHEVKRVTWSSERSLWTVEVARAVSDRAAARPVDEPPLRFTCRFLYMAPGYYAYDHGHTPHFEGAAQFEGRIVHPQHWTEDIDYAGKRVVVIGSGATAMTLVPALAKRAAHVTMLQRSPTYVVSAPAEDALARVLSRWLPAALAYAILRWKNVLLGILFFQLARRAPAFVKNLIVSGVKKELGPGYDVQTHFTPRYDVWDQRVCLVPDGDLFQAIRSGSASVVTDQIDRFTAHGVRLRSGTELPADLIVTATGLELRMLGGAEINVDGRRVEMNRTLNYKGCMFTGVPNLAYAFGYTNASWTLKADLTAEYVCRLLRHMDEIGATQCTPQNHDPSVQEQPWLDFSSGYVQRAQSILPKQGSKRPFKLHQNYALDLLNLRYGSVPDQALEFTTSHASHEDPVGSTDPLSRPR